MATVSSGVYPVYNNIFKIGTAGRNSTADDMAQIADCETFSISVDNNIEEWTPMELNGWIRRLMTGKGATISVTGKRNIGDAGNDYIAGLMFANGQDANSIFEWTFADGTVVTIPCVVSVSNAGSGDSTNAAPLEFEIQSDGEPTVVAAA